MKRWKLLIVLVLVLLATLTIASGHPPYRTVHGIRTITATVDSSDTDSTRVYDTTVVKIGGYRSMTYTYSFVADLDSLPGEGLDDSLKLKMEFWRRGAWYGYDSTQVGVGGDSITGAFLPAVGDTLFGEYVRFTTWFFDTVSDTTGTMVFESHLHLDAK